MTIRIFTLGFTRKSAETFFTRLRSAGIRRLIDVRLHNVSQLAGFSKRDDLAYFTKNLVGAEYLHLTELAPTQAMLDRYRKGGEGWDRYAREFLALMKKRRIEEKLDPRIFDRGCLLCSEEKPHQCHRRLIAEYLQKHWKGVEIEHLP